MTVRQGKRLTWLFAALALAALILDGVVAYLHPERLRFGDLTAPLLMLVLFLTLRRTYARLEAAHGPDYVQQTSKAARIVLIAAAVGIAALTAVAVYLSLGHR